ncbi:hypothetical protein D3C72_1526690 [compost metagenome]
MFRVLFSLIDLVRITNFQFFIDLFKAAFKIFILNLLRRGRIDLIQRIIPPINFVQFIGTGWEKHSFSQHLHFASHLKHVSGRRVIRILDVHLLQQILHLLAGSRLHCALVDRTRENEVGPQHERSQCRLRRSDPAGRPDPHFFPVAVLCHHFVTQPEHGRHQRIRNTAVRMAS